MENKKLKICVIFSILLCFVEADFSVRLTAEEEITGRSFLGNIADKVNLSESVNLDLTNVEYEIMESSLCISCFSIESNSDLYLDTKIDREEICPRETTCEISIEIAATAGTIIEIINVKVEIIDINDNSPKFSSSILRLSIAEGTPLATTYELPSASDSDTGINAIQTFSIEPSNTSFILKTHENLDGTLALNLVLNRSLDRETIDSYQLLIRAIDGGSQKLTGLLTVSVNVTDINDNQPVFDPTEYNATINEDIKVGTGIINVTATDSDIGENGKIAYSFTGMNPQTIANSIGINEETGQIYVKERFDSQKGPFQLYVEARDHGNPAKKSLQVRVVVNVRDINDNPPTIIINELSNGRFSENVDIGTPVAIIKIEDADIGLNGESNCTCDNSNFLIHKVSTNRFRVDVASEFDREKVDSYQVTINCTDKGDPSLSASESFVVTVDDENDNEPVFLPKQYSEDIKENEIAGYIILRVTATDSDIGRNGKITYEFEPFEHESKFTIDEDTGIIKARYPFDHEFKKTYIFTVTARDNGVVSLADTATVNVTVLDENDNAPEFEGDSYAMSVPENSNINKSVRQVKATDADEGNNKKISYMIPAKYSSYPFAVLDDGTIIATEKLDREETSYYEFEVVASDHGNPPKNTSVPVFVTVLDQNDNPPYIEFPEGENNTVSVAHNTLPNTFITNIIADDVDENENKKLTYSIISGNEDLIFQIEEETGRILLKKEVGPSDIKVHTLSISVKDQGETQLETRATLYIEFYIANETALTSTQSGSTGQNILIAIIISCVTFVLSVIIITAICLIRRKDRQSRLYNAKAYDEQKIMASVHRDSNRSSSSRGSKDKMIYPENSYMDNGYHLRKNKKEVSFSLEEQDGGLSLEPNGQFDPVSTFKSPSPVPQQNNIYDPNYHQEMTPPPKPERNEDNKQRDIHRITSLRVHQALIQSQNNNNSKQWPHSPHDQETGKTYMGLPPKTHLDDSHSETSGETTTSDSGRGGSEEDIRNSSMMNSHDTDESRSPNTSTSHPFYTSESQQPTFSSFHGNSVHRTGPILSSFLNRAKNNGPSQDSFKNSYPLNDLSNPHRNNNNQNRLSNENNIAPPPRNLNSALKYPNSFGHGQQKVDSDPLLHSSNPSNLNYRNSFENGSITGRSQDDDNTTTTSGSYTLNDLTDDMMDAEDVVKDMFYKPDTFV